MLPIPGNNNNLPPESGRQPIKRDFNNLDELLGELNQPKEQIQNTQAAQPTQPGNQINQPGSDLFTSSEKEPISAEVAALSGKTIANTIDTVFGTGMSLYAKNTTPEKYQASEKQMSVLEKSWAAVSQKYGYQLEDSPIFNAGLNTIAIYFPHFQEAKNDRRFALLDEKYELIKKRNDEMEARLKVVEKQSETAAKN